MKNVILVLLMLLLSNYTMAQVAQPNKANMTRAEKKALREAEQRQGKEQMLALVNTKKWVLEAHTVYDKSNRTYHISSMTNFVMVNDSASVVQLSFNSIAGWNGVGGVTLDGNVQNYEVIEGKPQSSVTVKFRTQQRGAGSGNVIMNVGSTGNTRVVLSGDFGSKITFQGKLVPLGESNVYKGTSMF